MRKSRKPASLDISWIFFRAYTSVDPNDQHDEAESLYNIVTRSVIFLHKENQDEEIVVDHVVDEAFDLTKDIFGQAQPPAIVHILDIGMRYAKNSNYDITFLLDNNTKKFQAHQCILRKVPDVFWEMLSDNYKDNVNRIIELPISMACTL